jgi:glutamate decarboxylase
MSHEHRGDQAADDISVNPLFSRLAEIPRWRIPDAEMMPETAYQVIHDELFLDGNARQNLATFVTTWMEPQAKQLYMDSFDKNIVDKDEYPQTAAIEERCLHILADLWNAPDSHGTIGTSTVGSSEACMLGGLAFKRRWQQARRAAGKPTDSPNIVFSSSVQVVWEKFANYWEVEPRYVPITKEEPYLTAEGMLSVVDENTIGVVPILGVTYNGVYEPVKALADALDDLRREPASTFRCTSMLRRVDSSRRFSIPTSSGTSVFRACTRSARRGTSSGSCTRVSAGSYGRSANTSPRS